MSTRAAARVNARVTLAQALLAQAELNLECTRIVAPQDGRVTRRNVELGNDLQPGV